MSKSNSNRERRETVEAMRRQAKAAERRRTIVVVSVCVVVALLIVGAAVFSVYQSNKDAAAASTQALGDLGTAAKSAGCDPVQQNEATGAGQHTSGAVTYATVPPSYGPHNPTPDTSGKHFFTASDRPDLEVLVHNLEHGWTITWYDETVAADKTQMQALEATATKFDSLDPDGKHPQYNMIIAPWTSADGDGQPIPDGKHIAFTHWSIHHPTYDASVFATKESDVPSWGESQYCSTFSGGALDAFMKQFPYDDAPEGFLWHQ